MGIRAGEIERGGLARDRQGEADAGRPALIGPGPGGVDRVLEDPCAVGEVGQRRPHPTFAVGDDLVEGFVGQLTEPVDPDLIGAPLGVEVAAPFRAGAGIGEQHGFHFGGEEDGRYPQPFLVHLGRFGRDRARRHPAHIGMVGPVGGPADEPAVVGEARRHERDVVEMRATGERVVENDLVTRSHPVAQRVDGGPHRSRHRPQMDRDVLRLGQQLPLGGEQRRRTVGPLLDVRRKGGTPQDRPHLVGDAREPRDEDPQRGRIETAAAGANRLRRTSDLGRLVRPISEGVTAGSPQDPGAEGRRFGDPPFGDPHGAVRLDRHHRPLAASALHRRQGFRVERRRPTRPGPQRHHFDRRLPTGVPVAACVFRVEGVSGGDAEFVALSRIAAVEGVLDLDLRFGRTAGADAGHDGAGLGTEFGERFVEPVPRGGVRPGAHEFALAG